jgi:hypothetical protein
MPKNRGKGRPLTNAGSCGACSTTLMAIRACSRGLVAKVRFERGDLPIALWKKAITTVPVYGGIECTKGSGKKNLTADEYRHAAAELGRAGADGVYLFNFFTSREGGEAAYEPPFEVLHNLVPTNVGFRGGPGVKRPDVEFKDVQFPGDEILRIYGSADDRSTDPDSFYDQTRVTSRAVD